MPRIRTLAAIVVAAVGTVGALIVPTLSDAGAVKQPAPAPTATTSPTPAPTTFTTASPTLGRPITFSDEFALAAGVGPDRSRWNFDTGSYGWHTEELEVYTDRTSNAAHDGRGHLVITARKDHPGGWPCPAACVYSSARLTTNGTFAQRYGRFEVRMQIPKGQGIWPAFWLLGDDFDEVGWPASGEIDVMENVGKQPNTVWATVHGPGYSGKEGLTEDRKIARPLGDDFHTYAVEWSPGLLVFLLDGQEYHRVVPADVGGDRWVFEKPFHLLLNVAVGGEWPGPPDASTRFPQSLVVDWVRVYAYEPTWAGGQSYTTGQIVTYDGVRYEVTRGHTSIPGWEPPAAPVLFTRL